MDKIKKVIVLGFVALVVIIFLIPRFFSTNTPTTVISTPKIPSLFEGEYQINFEVKESDFTFPSQIPLVSINNQSPISLSEAKDIALNLGFGTDPRTINDVYDGTTYVWSGEENSLLIYADIRKVTYSDNNVDNVPNRQLSDEVIQTAAKDFIVSNFNEDPTKLEFAFFTFYASDASDPDHTEITTKERATVYQVNFNYSATEAKIITQNPNTSPVSVWVLPDGRIGKASVIKLKDITKTTTTFKLKTYSEVQANINKAVIVSLDNGNISPLNLPDNAIQEVTVSQVELAYLLDSPDAAFLKPVYVFKGTASVIGIQGDVEASLYLPATTP